MKTCCSYQVLAVALTASAPAAAQVSAPVSDAPVAESSSTSGDIVVTAQRRSENLRDVPISVTAVSGSELSNLSSGGGDLRVLASRVPNVNAESTFGRVYPRFYIRGLGNDDYTVTAQSPVEMYIDDVVEENPFLKGMPAFDLQRVEVLRGPQGTLFGKNATAGAINLITVKPSQEVSGYARIGYGNFGTTNVEAAVGGPLVNDVLSARVSVLYQHRDNWVYNIVSGEKINGYDDVAARGQLLFTPTPEFKSLLQVSFRHLDGGGQLEYGLQTDANYGVLPRDREHIAVDYPNVLHVDTRGVNLNNSYDFGPVTLTSITSYQHAKVYTVGDVDGSPRQSTISTTSIPSLNQITEELRLSSNGSSRLTWQTGLYYFHDVVDYWNLSVNNSYQDAEGNPGFGAYQIAHQSTRSLAAFGQVTYNITDSLKVIGGARYTSDQTRFNQDSSSYTPKTTNLTGLPQFATDPFYTQGGHGPGPWFLPQYSSTSGNWSRPTWDISVDYKIDPSVNVYGRIAEGYHGGVVTGQAIYSALAKAGPESVLSYEVGVKTSFLGGRLRANADVYLYDYKNKQLNAYTLLGDGQEIIQLTNAKGGVGKGFEGDISFQVTNELLLSGNVGYAHTRIANGTFVASATDSSVAVDVGGQPFTFAPDWTAAINAGYRKPVGDGREIFASTDWAYSGFETFTLTSFQQSGYSRPGYWEGGARLGYRVGKAEISGWVRNLTDKKALTSALNVSGYAVFYNDPRTYGVEVAYRF